MLIMFDLINYIAKIIMVYIAYLSIVSAIMKISSFEYFIVNTHKISGFRINNNLIKYSAVIFLILELVIPFLSIAETKFNKLYILILGLIYILATIYILPIVIKGKRIECGCFGVYFKREINWYKIIENIIYICIIFFIYVIEDDGITYSTYVYALLLFLIRIYFLQKRVSDI